jgi:hypothetical protein
MGLDLIYNTLVCAMKTYKGGTQAEFYPFLTLTSDSHFPALTVVQYHWEKNT